MREIKFKAWDKTNGEWFMDGDTFDLNYSGGYGDFYFDNDHPKHMRDVKLEWLQYTGLHDKNGKEIWDGDIVKVDNVEPLLYIVFAEGAFVYEGGSAYYHHEMIEVDYTEVIGNIKENPELLNGSGREPKE